MLTSHPHAITLSMQITNLLHLRTVRIGIFHSRITENPIGWPTPPFGCIFLPDVSFSQFRNCQDIEKSIMFQVRKLSKSNFPFFLSNDHYNFKILYAVVVDFIEFVKLFSSMLLFLKYYFYFIFPAENKNVKKPKKQKKKNKYEQKSAWDQLCGTIPRVSRGLYTLDTSKFFHVGYRYILL